MVYGGAGLRPERSEEVPLGYSRRKPIHKIKKDVNILS